MVQWTEQFVTGSDTLDQQHRMLIANINHLETLLTSLNPTREEGEFLVHLVDFLRAYAQSHFRFEEQCMEQYRCPAHAENKLAHEQFLKFFSEFEQRSRAEGFRPDILRNLHLKLSSWIQDHVLRVDTQLRPCIKR